MADTLPDAPREPRFSKGHESEGRPAALIAWGLYILSLPSANLLVIVGLIVAYAGRGGSEGLSRAHIDAQIDLFWTVVWWTILLWVLIGVCVGFAVTEPVTVIVAVPFAILLGLGLFVLTVWFTIRSLFGLFNLLGGKQP